MKKIFNKSFWIGFVSGILFVIISIIAIGLCNYFCNPESYICTWDDPKNVQLRLDNMKRQIDSAKLKTYIDKSYNVKVLYPEFFHISDTLEMGKACFRYYDVGTNGEFILSLTVNPLNKDWDIKKILDYKLGNCNASSTTCLVQEKDYFILSGKRFVSKSVIVNNLWVEYNLSYNYRGEKAADRLVKLVKEWDPQN